MTNRRNRLLKLLASLDQSVTEAESLTVDGDLGDGEKRLRQSY